MDGWIYLLQERSHLDTDIYKLGRTGSISERLKSRDYRCCKIISICYCPGVVNIDNHNPSYKEAEDVIIKNQNDIPADTANDLNLGELVFILNRIDKRY